MRGQGVREVIAPPLGPGAESVKPGVATPPPADLPAGADVSVAWTSPDDRGDDVAILERDGDRFVTSTYSREGSSLALRLPEDPGA